MAGWKEAIVIPLGPLPGLIVAAVLGTAWAGTRNELLGRSALMFAIINAFNLLPVMPLDGGRLLQILFFVRNRAGATGPASALFLRFLQPRSGNNVSARIETPTGLVLLHASTSGVFT